MDKEIKRLTAASGEWTGTRVIGSRQASKLKKFLVGCGFTKVEAHQGYLYAYAFATSAGGQAWYFHVDDERGGCMPDRPLLMRTCLDYTDFSGRGSIRNEYPLTVEEVREAARR